MAVISLVTTTHYDTEANATRFCATVRQSGEMWDNPLSVETEVVYSRNAEFLWEEGQAVSIRAALLKAFQRMVEAAHLDSPF